ncbi:MAG: precorrin-6y C5,15-methyltransferase (decarboxylating) subunit CbiE [Bacteroidaceae bacterium]|nr:precorrin-6y C5,15-methyltransferase (decarboxylating) subunit CbiE [Bacteroidaceae bacterium]
MCETKRFVIIGISDSASPFFLPEVESVIVSGKVFSGGERHREIMRSRLPAGARWIDIRVPLGDVFRQYEECFAQHDEIIVFASGDPFFYGFASTIRRECPDATMRVFPTFNSLQMLAHRLQLPYESLCAVSLTGRPWDRFDEAVIRGEALIGCLTDHHHTPQAICQRLADYGYDNYAIAVGENLGNEEKERVRQFAPTAAPEELAACETPNCVILRRTKLRNRPFGIPDSAFHLLDGREKMITKMPIRLLALSMLDLRHRHTFWDVGSCTGSVSIEAKLQFPHLHVNAFEVRQEGRTLLDRNSRKFGVPGIACIIGDFLEADLSCLAAPDAVFIGGHGGRLPEMVQRLGQVLQADGTMVFNAVSEESRRLFVESTAQAGLTLVGEMRIAIDTHNPIVTLKAIKPSKTV